MKNSTAAAGSGALYSLGIFGAWVYFWQQADSFWEYALAILEGRLLASVDGLPRVRRAPRVARPGQAGAGAASTAALTVG